MDVENRYSSENGIPLALLGDTKYVQIETNGKSGGLYPARFDQAQLLDGDG